MTRAEDDILRRMRKISMRLFAASMGIVIGWAVLVCAYSSDVSMQGGHHHQHSAFGEHVQHIQAMTIAIVPAFFFYALVFVALLVALFVIPSFDFVSTDGFSVHDPPVREKLKRLLFSLRSPPALP